MRTDATIDGKQVICRNASMIGFSSVKLRVGMTFIYRENGTTRLARMLGRIAYAPPISGDAKPVRNFILAMVLGDNGSFAFERWVDPADVIETTPTPSKFAAFFFSPELPYGAQTMRRLMDHGACCEQFIEHAPERVAEWTARAIRSA